MHLPEYIFILACVHVLIWFLVLTFIGGNLLTDFLLHSTVRTYSAYNFGVLGYAFNIEQW